VKGRHQRDAPATGEQSLDAAPHLAGGFVGEGHGEDPPRIDAAGHQIRDAVGDHARLAAARAREHEERALGQADGLPLRRVQPG
jgi:hypothetical protein